TQETNFKKYEIERSLDANSFNKIGELAGQNLANYSYTDKELPNASIVYYRLKMIDIDGTFSYSRVLPIRLNNNFTNALVYPNPTTGPLNVRLTEAIKANSNLIITDVTGRVVKQQMVNKGIFSVDLKVNDLPAGRYFIRINDQQNVIRQSFVIVK
ncbi:MAG: T9SS type A sorting domain-containing protein, partial [Sphingobacteriales bacterium]